MVNRINANPATLDQVATQLRHIVSDIQAARSQLTRAGNDTQIAWQSQMTGQFMQSVRLTERRIDTLANNVNAIANKLSGTAIQVRRTEQEIRNLKSRQ